MIHYFDLSERIMSNNITDWIKDDVIIYVNRFTEDSVKDFAARFDLAHESDQDIIPIVIDSFGGEPYAALAMIDLIQASEKQIATITIGKAMSCGAILLTCGDEGLRFASPMSTIMIHDVSMETEGKMKDIKVDADEGERLNNIIFDLMDKNCGHKKGHLSKILKDKHSNSDWYISPREAKKLNIVNHIKVPKLITHVSVKSELV